MIQFRDCGVGAERVVVIRDMPGRDDHTSKLVQGVAFKRIQKIHRIIVHRVASNSWTSKTPRRRERKSRRSKKPVT